MGLKGRMISVIDVHKHILSVPNKAANLSNVQTSNSGVTH